MDTKVTFQDLYLRVAPAEKTLPEEKTVLKLAEAAHWAVSRFENDGRWVCEIFTENTPLPYIAKERKATIEREIVKETGIEWQIEWAVAHEINTQPIKVPDIHIDDEQAEQVLKGLAVAAGIVVAAAFIIPLLFLAAFAGACASNDPALLIKCRDENGAEVWIALCKWY